MLVKLIPAVLILIGIVVLLFNLKGSKKVKEIDTIKLEDLAPIWLDKVAVKVEEKPVKQREEVKAVEVVNYDKDTGEVIVKQDILTEFISELLKIINIADSNGRYGAFTIFDTDNVFISQKSFEEIAERLAVSDVELISELQREGYTDSGYKLYKIFNRDSKSVVYKNINIKLFCTEDIERRKGKRFNITNIEEVKTV